MCQICGIGNTAAVPFVYHDTSVLSCFWSIMHALYIHSKAIVCGCLKLFRFFFVDFEVGISLHTPAHPRPRCHDAATGALRWAIPNAHRAPVTCCAVRFDSSASFLVTGAEDGSVSVWDLRTRWGVGETLINIRGTRTTLSRNNFDTNGTNRHTETVWYILPVQNHGYMLPLP